MTNPREYRLTAFDETENETWHVWEFESGRWICVGCEIRRPGDVNSSLAADPDAVKHMAEDTPE